MDRIKHFLFQMFVSLHEQIQNGKREKQKRKKDKKDKTTKQMKSQAKI